MDHKTFKKKRALSICTKQRSFVICMKGAFKSFKKRKTIWPYSFSKNKCHLQQIATMEEHVFTNNPVHHWLVLCTFTVCWNRSKLDIYICQFRVKKIVEHKRRTWNRIYSLIFSYMSYHEIVYFKFSCNWKSLISQEVNIPFKRGKKCLHCFKRMKLYWDEQLLSTCGYLNMTFVESAVAASYHARYRCTSRTVVVWIVRDWVLPPHDTLFLKTVIPNY